MTNYTQQISDEFGFPINNIFTYYGLGGAINEY